MTHRWRWRTRLPERHGQPCRILARGKMNSILVLFADGLRVVTSGFAVRRIHYGTTKDRHLAEIRWTLEGMKHRGEVRQVADGRWEIA